MKVLGVSLVAARLLGSKGVEYARPIPAGCVTPSIMPRF